MTGLSLLLCLATVATWVRSYMWATGAAVGRVNRPDQRIEGLTAVTYRGALDVRFLVWKYGAPKSKLWDRTGTKWNWGTFNQSLAETTWEPVRWKSLGFWFGFSDDGARKDWFATSPLGMFVIIFAVKPARALFLRMRA